MFTIFKAFFPLLLAKFYKVFTFTFMGSILQMEKQRLNHLTKVTWHLDKGADINLSLTSKSGYIFRIHQGEASNSSG